MTSTDITASDSTATHPTAIAPGGLPLTLTEAGEGRTALVLHGGGGPFTVAAIATHLAATMHTVTPTHPGWDGAARPEWITGVDDLAVAYLDCIEDHDLHDVLVVGSSLGGWIAAEMAVRDRAGRISELILIDAGGIEVDGEPMVDFFSLDARELADHAFVDSDRFYTDPASLPPTVLARQKANAETMRILAGDPYMHDPKLPRRLARARARTLVLWGEGDRVFTPGYGASYAAAFPDARFEIVPGAGHLPHIEQPEATFERIDAFMAESPAR